MKHIPVQMNEPVLHAYSSRWVDAVEQAIDRQLPEVGPNHPVGQWLQGLDRDLSAWRKACRRGTHSFASAQAALRVMKQIERWDTERLAQLRRRSRT